MEWVIVLVFAVYAYPLYRLSRRVYRGITILPPDKDFLFFRKMVKSRGVIDAEYAKSGGRYCAFGRYESRKVSVEKTKLALNVRMQVIQKFWIVIASDRTILNTDHQEAAAEFLNHDAVRQELARLRAFNKLEIRRGKMEVVFPQGYKMDSDVLSTLNSFLRCYEIQSQMVRVWHAVPSAKICPYCREAIDDASVPLYECPDCRVILHSGCWMENRHCTTWGCCAR